MPPRISTAASDGEITAANKRFYDEIAGCYESVDSRRNSGDAHAWLDAVLASLAERAKQSSGAAAPSFLDAGCGTGFLVERARPFFGRRIAVDVSQKMLDRIREPKVEKVCASVTEIPLASGSLDCVGAFATLHHLYAPEIFFREAHRLLKRGGVLYTDHDIAAPFVRRFDWPLRLYRIFFDHGRKYLAACPRASGEDYELSEFHGHRGLSGENLRAELLRLGFRDVEVTYHWQGMGIFACLQRCLPDSWLSRAGRSPILRIIAIK